MTHPASPHAHRRQRLAALLRAEGGGVAVIPSGQAVRRNSDVEHPFRADSQFLYLTGFTEPKAFLIVRSDGHSTVLLAPSDPEHELWEGKRLGVDAAPASLGVDLALPNTDLTEHLPTALCDQAQVWWPQAEHPDLTPTIMTAVQALRNREHKGVLPPSRWANLSPLIDELRLFKDSHEQALMRRAGTIGSLGHVRAMQACARAQLAPPPEGLREYHLEAELLYAFRHGGATGPAYPSIVAGGANACILHHAAGDAALRAGDLCLIDAGCEFAGYASDITRTFPINGRFSGPQADLYAVVLAAQEAAIAVTAPGRRKQDAHWAAVRVLAQGMLDLGLLDPKSDGHVDTIIERGLYRRFYMHGTGHWLGLDVHDVGDYLQRNEAPIDQPDGQGGRIVRAPSRVLQEGMVITIEPGLYVRPDPKVPEAFWNQGIRIEDDVLVTAKGCELLSRGVPVNPQAIEDLMAQAMDTA